MCRFGLILSTSGIFFYLNGRRGRVRGQAVTQIHNDSSSWTTNIQKSFHGNAAYQIDNLSSQNKTGSLGWWYSRFHGNTVCVPLIWYFMCRNAELQWRKMKGHGVTKMTGKNHHHSPHGTLLSSYCDMFWQTGRWTNGPSNCEVPKRFITAATKPSLVFSGGRTHWLLFNSPLIY